MPNEKEYSFGETYSPFGSESMMFTPEAGKSMELAVSDWLKTGRDVSKWGGFKGELKKGISKHKRANQERHKEKRALTRTTTTKSGKEIVYSASPGGEKNRYHNAEFEESRYHKIKSTPPEIFNTTNNTDDDTQ